MAAALALPSILSPSAAADGWAATALPTYRGIRLDDNPANLATELDLTEQAGANTVVYPASWELLQPRSREAWDQGQLFALDLLVDGAAIRGMKVILSLYRTPCWATSAPLHHQDPCLHPDYWEQYPPRSAADFGRAVSFLVNRYGSKLAAFEVWKEPDHASHAYLRGPDLPRHYAELVFAADSAMRQLHSPVTLLAGSLVGARGLFLQALYDQGIKGHYGGLSVDFYGLTLASVRAIEAVRRANHDRKPIWLMEQGWPSCGSGTEQGYFACVTEGQQAQNLTDVIVETGGRRQIKAITVFRLADDAGDVFGLVDQQLQPKPAYAAVQTAFTAATRPAITPVTAGVAVRDGRKWLTGTGPAGDVIVVRAAQRGQLAYNPILALGPDGHYWWKLPPDLEHGRFRVLAQSPWSREHAVVRLVRGAVAGQGP